MLVETVRVSRLLVTGDGPLDSGGLDRVAVEQCTGRPATRPQSAPTVDPSAPLSGLGDEVVKMPAVELSGESAQLPDRRGRSGW